MAITSEDIHNQSFTVDRKGYDVDEVDVFLEHVADEIDNLNNQIADLQDQLSDSRFDGFDTPAKPIEEAPVAAPAPSSAPAQNFSQELDEANARIRELESQLEEKQADGNAIAQNIRNNLLTWKGEFPLNTGHGTEWQRVMGRPISEAQDEADDVLRASIFQEPYVKEIDELTPEITGRSLGAEFTGTLYDGSTVRMEVTASE